MALASTVPSQQLVSQDILEPSASIPSNLHYAPLIGIGSGNASSLPPLVLRSMLKQRRILMRMH